MELQSVADDWTMTMVAPFKDTGIRSRKIYGDNYRKNNYWSQPDPEKPSWYVWDGIISPIDGRSRSEERPQKCFDFNSDSSTMTPKKDLREYLMTSTLHGLRYIGEGKLTWFERFFWLAAFCFSIICAVFFIMNIYDKWQSSPMIVSVNPKNMALNDIPFPAITICNVNQAKKSVAMRYRQNGTSLDRKLLQSVCTTGNDTGIFDNSTSDTATAADWDYTRSFLINVTQPCSEMLAECYWNSRKQVCAELFNAQLTDEGLCCTFNVVHRNMMFRNPNRLSDLNLTFPSEAVDWTPEGGFPENAPLHGFPWRPAGVGTHHGLTLVLDANIDEYYCASTSYYGFKILLHSPTETPKIANLGDTYAPGIEARVEIIPQILDAQQQIMSIGVDQRQCVFSSERTLVFYRTYTQNNCEMECEAATMLEKCNCVQYYMPKNRSNRVCGKADAACYSEEEPILSSMSTNPETCACLPSCTEISYTVRRSTAPLGELLIGQNKYVRDIDSQYVKKNMLIVHFFFEGKSFVRYTKGEIFGLTEFLSNTGGLLGLCMGFSMMSFVELIYFLTLRNVCKSVRRPHKTFVRKH